MTYRTAKVNRSEGEPYWVVRYGPDEPGVLGATILTQEGVHYMFETQEHAACIAHALNHAFRRGREEMRGEMCEFLGAEG